MKSAQLATEHYIPVSLDKLCCRLVVVDELAVKVMLSGSQAAVQYDREALLDGYTLYVAKDPVAAFSEVFAELSRLVKGGSKDSATVDFLTALAFQMMAKQDPESLLARRACGLLPTTIQPWVVSSSGCTVS